jgi:hypothetical protein
VCGSPLFKTQTFICLKEIFRKIDRESRLRMNCPKDEDALLETENILKCIFNTGNPETDYKAFPLFTRASSDAGCVILGIL